MNDSTTDEKAEGEKHPFLVHKDEIRDLEALQPLVEGYLSQDVRKSDTPNWREKRIVELMKAARLLLHWASHELDERNKVCKRTIPDFDTENDGMNLADEKIGDALHHCLDDVYYEYDNESDPDEWEWSFLVGDKVRTSKDGVPGTIVKIIDDEIYECHILHEDGSTEIARDMYDITFVSRDETVMQPKREE